MAVDVETRELWRLGARSPPIIQYELVGRVRTSDLLWLSQRLPPAPHAVLTRRAATVALSPGVFP